MPGNCSNYVPLNKAEQSNMVRGESTERGQRSRGVGCVFLCCSSCTCTRLEWFPRLSLIHTNNRNTEMTTRSSHLEHLPLRIFYIYPKGRDVLRIPLKEEYSAIVRYSGFCRKGKQPYCSGFIDRREVVQQRFGL